MVSAWDINGVPKIRNFGLPKKIDTLDECRCIGPSLDCSPQIFQIFDDLGYVAPL